MELDMDGAEVNRAFYVFRYTIVEESQSNLYSLILPNPKGRAVIEALGVNGADKYFYKNGVNYSFVGFKWVKPSGGLRLPEDRYLAGKLAKRRLTETGTHVPGDIVVNSTEDWVGLITIFDTETQHIIIEKNWKFGTPEQIETALQFGLSKEVYNLYNCNLFVKGRTKKHIFWNLVNESRSIYSLEMKLISPNILNANKTARQALEDLKNIFVQDEIDISLRNESGNLAVPKDPIGDYIEYISEGEGSWKITSKLNSGKRKQTFSSLQNVDLLELPSPLPAPDTPPDQVQEMQKQDILNLVVIAHEALEKYKNENSD